MCIGCLRERDNKRKERLRSDRDTLGIPFGFGIASELPTTPSERRRAKSLARELHLSVTTASQCVSVPKRTQGHLILNFQHKHIGIDATQCTHEQNAIRVHTRTRRGLMWADGRSIRLPPPRKTRRPPFIESHHPTLDGRARRGKSAPFSSPR